MKSEKAIVIGIVFALAMLAFVGSASATTYYVNPGESIQNAVNTANSGDTIIVRDGTYTENVYVNKRLTIRSENGPETTIVRAAFSLAHVLTVTADYVNISGFTVRQVSSPSGYYASAIVLEGANGCKISKNKVDFASWSISLSNSKNNIIENNTVIHAGTGIGLSLSSKYNIVRNNTVEWTNIGIYVRLGSHENTITHNKIINNRRYGIKLERSNRNIIYFNDFMNNPYSADSTNIWNSTRRLTYTYDGNTYTNYLGNYWNGYSGTDNNNDGIGDTPYPIDSDKDNYPLMEPRENYFVTPTELPDLTLSSSDITLSNPNPAVGETVTITAAIHNIGNADATDVIVQFFDGDQDTGGTQIGNDQTSASLNAGGTGTAQVDWTATSGSHDIYVIADPYDDISESNENNNEAHINCVVEPGQPSVVITNITASPDHVSPGHTVTISVDTRNDGAAGFADVGVTVWGPLGDYLCNLKWQGYNFEEGETPTLTYLYTVPEDAELVESSYDVGARAWDACTGTCEGQCCPEGLCSGRHNDGLIREGVFKVEVLSGSLTVTVMNAADNTLPDCGGEIKVQLYDKDYIYIKTESKTYSGGESSVQVQFDNLVNEQHFIEVYHTPNSDLKLDEFWGVDEVTVSGTTTKDFVRHTQVVYDIKINGESPYGNEIVVNAGDQVHVDITVKNFEDGTSANNVKARLILDQDKSSPYDFDETHGPISISHNGEDDFGFDCLLEEAGTYYFYIVVHGEYNSNYIVVDQHDWYKAVVASLLPDLTVFPNSWNFGTIDQCSILPEKEFTLTNVGKVDLIIDYMEYPDWMTLSGFTQGTISPNELEDFTVTIDYSGLPIGDVAGDVIIHSNDPDGDLPISVEGEKVFLLPPLPVNNFQADPSDERIMLQWDNPSSLHFEGTIIRYRTDRYPNDPSDGELVCDNRNNPSSHDSFNFQNIDYSTPYYFTAFSYDHCGQYSIGATLLLRYIAGVPCYDQYNYPDPWCWCKGKDACGPVASACVLSYWDDRGYDNLVDGTDVDALVQDLKVAQLCIPHGGGTSFPMAVVGLLAVCNDQIYGNNYNFHAEGIQSVNWQFLKNEIDVKRPLIYWVGDHPIFHYEGHFAALSGYIESGPDKWLIVCHPMGGEKMLIDWNSGYVDGLIVLRPPPLADANGPYTGVEGVPIAFDCTGSYDPDGSIDLYEWDFDSDGAYDVSSATSTAIFTWGDDHTGTVELRVTDNDGLSGTDTAGITVNNIAPTASIVYVEQPEDFILPYHSLTFNGAFGDAGWLDTHTASWDFGDDTIISGTLTEENDQPDATGTTTAEHAYVEPGTYTVTLTVTDDDGGTGDYTTTVTVISADEAAGMIIDQLEISSVPAEAPKGVSQKIESAIDKLEQVIDFLDQGKYCDAIGKLDGMITQIEGAIDQVNEQRCSIKECKGKKCSCIADEDADKLIESLEHAKEGAIAIRDLISAEHPECA